jgi:hypothetical protein
VANQPEIMFFLFFTLSFALLTAATPIERRSGTSTEDITYILPIWEGSLASHRSGTDLAVLSDMENSLGLGRTYTKLGWSFSSWALSRDIQDSSNDYNFDPTNLNYQLNLAVSSSLPILIHMNNCRWADCCTPNSSGGWGDTLLDFIASQPNTTMLSSSRGTEYAHNFGSNYITLSRLNIVYRQYKKRNVQASASVLASFAASNPSLFIGVSLDSETIHPNSGADYNPLAITECKQWLQNTGIYGPGGDYFGAGRVPAFTDIGSFNTATGQNFTSWDVMQPPSTLTPRNPFSEEWERWRVTMIIPSVSDETLWIESAGIDRTLIYGHPTPRLDDYNFADDIQTETAANGASGVTYYGWTPTNFGSVDNAMRGSGQNNFGAFEINPLTNDTTTSYNTLLMLYNDGIKVDLSICHEVEQANDCTRSFARMRGSQIKGTQTNIHCSAPQHMPIHSATLSNSFSQTHGNSRRNLAPEPWNPGTHVYDFYDSFSSTTSTGPDNHVEATGSVGNVVRKSVYSAVGGAITYTVSLPSVSAGQRLNFWTSLGIKDGAGVGGETQFHVTINGQNLFGKASHLHLLDALPGVIHSL